MTPSRPLAVAFVLATLAAGLCWEVGCSGDAPRSSERAALAGDDPPMDFSIGLTVPSERPGGPRAGRYILLPDWTLRVALGPGASETTFPSPIRTLDKEQVRRVWWDFRDSGLLEGIDLPPTATPTGAATVLSYAAGGKRRTAYFPIDGPGTEQAASLKRLADRMISLAWMDKR